MRVMQHQWTATHGWTPSLARSEGTRPQIVFVFGARQGLQDSECVDALRRNFPGAVLIGGSTSGEVLGNEVYDDTLVVSAVTFEKTGVAFASTRCPNGQDSHEAGRRLAEALPHDGLAHVFVLANGLHVNGSTLAGGLVEGLPENVAVTGGLAGDAADFDETWVIAGDDDGATTVAAVGLYGDALRVGHGARGGWEPFGPARYITRADGGVLRALDGEPALGLYKRYLGDLATRLPGSALLFPIEVRREGVARGAIRMVLGIDEEEQSMSFAGDVEDGGVAQVQRATTRQLIGGAQAAAEAAVVGLDGIRPEFTLLVSCVGRKLMMKQRVDEELEAVRVALGHGAVTGFYGYGALCPFEAGTPSVLHNQTMTITAFAEI